jgi:nitroreductase
MVTNPVIEAMETCRAMRYLKPDPVPDELLETVLYGATRASNPSNSQLWEFVVVRDAEQRARIAGAMKPVREHVLALRREWAKSERPDPTLGRIVNAEIWEKLAEVPVLIFVCGRKEPHIPAGSEHDSHGGEVGLWSAMLSASQNLIVAARSLGLGTVNMMTHVYPGVEPELRKIVGLPDDVTIGTFIPLGWPGRPFGKVRRKPLAEVVHYDRW